MSFGFSASDFVTLSKLLKSTIEAYKHGPREYRAVRTEASALKSTLDRLQADANDPESPLNQKGSDRRKELLRLIGDTEPIVKDLNALIERRDIPVESKRGPKKVYHAVRVGRARGDISALTGRLTFHVGCITAFLQSLEGPALTRIEKKLDLIYHGLFGEGSGSSGRAKSSSSGASRASSPLSNAESVRSRLENNEDDVWIDLKRALSDEGLATGDLVAYRNEIIQYLKERLDEDVRNDQATQQSNELEDNGAVPPLAKRPRISSRPTTSNLDMLPSVDEFSGTTAMDTDVSTHVEPTQNYTMLDLEDVDWDGISGGGLYCLMSFNLSVISAQRNLAGTYTIRFHTEYGPRGSPYRTSAGIFGLRGICHSPWSVNYASPDFGSPKDMTIFAKVHENDLDTAANMTCTLHVLAFMSNSCAGMELRMSAHGSVDGNRTLETKSFDIYVPKAAINKGLDTRYFQFWRDLRPDLGDVGQIPIATSA